MKTNHTILHFPVNLLIEQSVQIFQELGNKYEFQKNQAKGLSNRIKVEISDGPITNAAQCALHYDEDNNPYCQISVWDNFCQYLWAVCYASLVVLEDSVLPHDSGKEEEYDEREKKAYELFMSGMSLFSPDEQERASRSRFFEFPNPACNPDDDVVQATNCLFIRTLCFVLYHEYYHFDLGHMEAQEHKKSDEYEADFSAFYSMYADKPLETRKVASWAIILILGSIILIHESMDGGEAHPDPDDRLGSIISQMEDLDPLSLDYCYGMAITIYKLWAFYHSKTDLIPKVTEAVDMKSYFQIIQQAVADSKQA